MVPAHFLRTPSPLFLYHVAPPFTVEWIRGEQVTQVEPMSSSFGNLHWKHRIPFLWAVLYLASDLRPMGEAGGEADRRAVQ